MEWEKTTTLEEEAIKAKYNVDEVYIITGGITNSLNTLRYKSNPTIWTWKKYHPDIQKQEDFLMVGFYNNSKNQKHMKIILPVKNNEMIKPGDLNYDNFIDLYGAKALCLKNYLTQVVKEYNTSE